MDKKLEEKRDTLSVKLQQLKSEYLMIINSNCQDKQVIKNSLLKQIEVLVELINTVKIKLSLIQQLEGAENAHSQHVANNIHIQHTKHVK
jgi:hypothetical protein